VGVLAAQGNDATLWARRQSLVEEMRGARCNTQYLPGATFPERLAVSADLPAVAESADLVIMGVPSHGFRAVAQELAPHLRPGVALVSLSKGVEQGSLLRMTEVLAQTCPGHPVGVLTGPNLASEVAAGFPAAAVVAMDDAALASEVQRLLTTSWFRVYTNDDLVGSEVAGALKNVMAIASGMASGSGFGDNTRAALLTRGLAEMARLGVALGGKVLIATCTSTRSRNYTVGFRLGQGERLDDIVASMQMVAEGIKSTGPVLELAARVGVDMPIASEVGAALYESRPVTEVVTNLLSREVSSEFAGLES
jgi:glycerol-3-phosphate dehydrogenase (NAD(P)+)